MHIDGSFHSSIKFIIGEIIRSGCRHSLELLIFYIGIVTNLAWRMCGIDNGKGSPVPCNDFDDIPSVDVCDDISAMEDDVVAVLCDVCCGWRVFSSFFLPFFRPQIC